jgi:peptidoglycan/LPS O-acetylase OafA/YrhL/glycosyltransferase involved in cell wall biosynthesis
MVIGVPMFFVISGYCITAAAHAAQLRSHSFGTFMYRRARRIYPPYFYLILGTCLAVATAWAAGYPRLFTDDSFPIPHPASMTWDQWLGNLTLTETWRAHLFGSSTQFFVGHAWTLCYEEQFYLLTGICLLIFGRRIGMGLLAITIVTFLVIAIKLPLNGFFFDGHWFMFAAGCAVYYFAHRGQRALRVGLILSLAIPIAGTFLLRSYRWSYFSTFAEAPLFALILVALWRWDSRVVGSAPGRLLARIGKMSYSLYLVHLPVTKAIGHCISDLGVSEGWPAIALSVSIGTLSSLAVGYAFFRFVELRYVNKPWSRSRGNGTDRTDVDRAPLSLSDIPTRRSVTDNWEAVPRLLAQSGDAVNRVVENPLVSIVIPCYKGARYLDEAIDSCLNQTYRNVEVIVVDDASPDDCYLIAERRAELDRRVRVVRHESNQGVAEAFNTGFQCARGAFHTRLAQDDRFKPQAVEQLIRGLLTRAAYGLAYADYDTIDERGVITGSMRLPGPEQALTWGNGLGVCVMWRTAVWDTVGVFDSSLDAAEDFDYWVRVADRFEITKVESTLLEFRVHDSMGSIVHTRKQESASWVVRQRQVGRTPLLSVRHWVAYRTLSHHCYSFSYDHSVSDDHWGALARIILSFVYWPLPYPRARVKTSFARVRLFTMICWRLLKAARLSPMLPSRAIKET